MASDENGVKSKLKRGAAKALQLPKDYLDARRKTRRFLVEKSRSAWLQPRFLPELLLEQFLGSEKQDESHPEPQADSNEPT